MPEPFDCPKCGELHPNGCRGHSSRTSKPCKRHPLDGASVCNSHGARAPQVKAKAAEVVVARQAMAHLARLGEMEPLDDPIGTLQRKLAEHVALSDVVTAKARELIEADDWTVTFKSQGEQVRAVIKLAKDWGESCAKLLVDTERLGLDERRQRVDEAQLAVALGRLREVLVGVVDDSGLGLSRGQKDRLRELVRERL